MEYELTVKFTDRELDILHGYAKLHGLKISEVVKGAVLEKLKEEGFTDDDDRGEQLKTLKKIYEGLSLDDLFAGYDDVVFRSEEIDWGDPVGEEVW